MLIGVTGYAKHGKDSIGRVLVEEYGFKRFAFADQLKSMALVLNPYVNGKYSQRLYTLVQDAGWDNAKLEPEVRRFLQVLGTEAVRDHLGEDAWVKALELVMADYGILGRGGTGSAVVTDVRFHNEASWIHNKGGKLWRVTRLNADGSVYDNGLGTDHPSERYIHELPADVDIEAHTLEDLAREVRGLM